MKLRVMVPGCIGEVLPSNYRMSRRIREASLTKMGGRGSYKCSKGSPTDMLAGRITSWYEPRANRRLRLP